MFVIKRNGTRQQVSFDKITKRIINLVSEQNINDVKPIMVSQSTISKMYNGMTTREIDELSAKICASLASENPEYSRLGGAICISNLQKNTKSNFCQVIDLLVANVDEEGNPLPIINKELHNVIKGHRKEINEKINYKRDFNYDYFGFKTMEKIYLLKIKNHKGENVIVERPQHMLMRVSLAIHGSDLQRAFETYDYMSNMKFTHASPTLFNAGTPNNQFSSCFLLGTDDSIRGIYKTLGDCAEISKRGGGIGVHVSNVRAKDSKIKSTNGKSDGIIPMLKVFNSTCRYVNQCLLPLVTVYSQNGFKRMDEVTTKDYLITKDGSFKKVNEVIINEKDEEIFNIKTQHGIDALQCTGCHDILAVKAIKTNGLKRAFERVKRGSNKIEFIRADEVTTEHLLGFPIPTYENDIHNFTEDQARMLGIMLGDGNISHTNNGGDRYQITLNHTTKQDTMEFVLNYLQSRTIHYWISNDAEIGWTYNETNIAKMNITEDMIYDENRDKRLLPEYLHLPKNKLMCLLRGFLESDGCVTKTGIWFMSTSKNLIYSVKYLFLRLGILASVQTVDKVGQTMSYNKHNRPIISRKISYSLRIPKDKFLKENNIFTREYEECKSNKRDYYTYDNILWTRVKEITKSHYTGKVYDFNMIDNHNYLTDGGLVHNSGRRKGAFAMYLEPWHADVEDFLELRKPVGLEEKRARDLFLAMWVPDLFMKKVEADEDWYLFCPSEAPGLTDVWGDQFDQKYNSYVENKKYRKVVKARLIWNKILESQIETGMPYIAYKDSINKKSNQQNIGTIKSSNLCIEIMEVSNDKEYAVCNLNSIALNRFVTYPKFDKKFIVYTKVGCKYCRMSKYVLSKHNYKFEVVELEGDALKSKLEELGKKVKKKLKTVPQIFFDDETYIGGYTELSELLRPSYDFNMLKNAASISTRNINKIINKSLHPTIETLVSDMNNRPIGVGVQGLADTFAMMGYSFDSHEARVLNHLIFETIYYGCIQESINLAKEHEVLMNDYIKNKSKDSKKLLVPNYINDKHFDEHLKSEKYKGAYPRFVGSPFSEGKFQFNLWSYKASYDSEIMTKNIHDILKSYKFNEKSFKSLWNWQNLRKRLIKYGIRNSLLTALMPTASTSQLLGNNECFEAFTSNIYRRDTVAGSFIIINKHLVNDLKLLNIWNKEMKENIILHNGSVQQIETIPEEIKSKYKTVWEIKQKVIIDLAADRGKFVDQSQSMNLAFRSPNSAKLTSAHFHSWRKGLKTGMYYLRSRPASEADKFSIKSKVNRTEPEDCLMCSA